MIYNNNLNMNSIINNQIKFKAEIPVLIIVFNRPKLTKRLLKSLELLKPSKIYVAADGPREGNLSDLDLCKYTQDLLNTEISWECKIEKKISSSNIGVKNNCKGGIDWFFSFEEMGIMLEDDCEVNESFFKYCEELLIKYKDDNKIKVISGNFYFTNILKNSYYFSRCPGTHGWATWKRVWLEVDMDMKNFSYYRDFFWLIFFFKFNIVKAHYFYKKFSYTYEGKISSWDYQFLYAIYKNNGLIIRPFTSLSKHIGWGENATHSKGSDQHPEVQIEEMTFPMQHPINFNINSKFDDLEMENIRRVRFFPYIKYLIINKLFSYFKLYKK